VSPQNFPPILAHSLLSVLALLGNRSLPLLVGPPSLVVDLGQVIAAGGARGEGGVPERATAAAPNINNIGHFCLKIY